MVVGKSCVLNGSWFGSKTTCSDDSKGCGAELKLGWDVPAFMEELKDVELSSASQILFLADELACIRTAPPWIDTLMPLQIHRP